MTQNDLCYIRVRPKILLFSGRSQAQSFPNALNTATTQSEEIPGLTACTGAAASTDVHVAYRLTKDSREARGDVCIALTPQALQGLSCAVGDWDWDAYPSKPDKNKSPKLFFPSNASRDALVISGCDLLVMELKDNCTEQPYTTNIDKLTSALQVSIKAMYRCPDDSALLTDSVLGLTGDAVLLKHRRKVADKLGCASGSYEGSKPWQAFLRLLTTSLPFENDLQIIGTLGGASGCVVALIGTPGKAPFIVKIGTPFAIAQELRGFLQVIQPKLQNHVSRPVLFRPGRNGALFTDYDPSATASSTGEATLGMTLLTLVGQPGNADKPESLSDLLTKALEVPATAGSHLLSRLKTTLTGLIQVLHKDGQVCQRTVWQSYGSHLPPWLELDYTPANDPTTNGAQPSVISYREGGDERGMLVCDALQLIKLSESTVGHMQFERMGLFQVESSGSKTKVEMFHPRLGVRFLVNVRSEHPDFAEVACDLPQQAWLRRGHYVDALLRLKERSSIELYRSAAVKAIETKKYGPDLISPLEFFMGVKPTDDKPNSRPNSALAEAVLHLTFPTAIGAIHGDLNLGNMLFSGDDSLGWMIDFDRSVAQGPIATDYAKLQIEVLQHHGFKLIYALAGILAEGDDPTLLGDSFELLDAIFNHLHFQPTGNLLHGLRGKFAIDGKKSCWARILHVTASENLYAARLQLLIGVLELIQGSAMKTLDAIHGSSTLASSSASANDLALARASYAFSAIKHVMKSEAADITAAAMLYHIASHSLNVSLGKVPASKTQSLDEFLNIKSWTGGDERKTARRMLLSQHLHQIPCTSLPELTTISGRSKQIAPIFGDVDGERCWDVASTGGLANLSPIMGYLLLMSRTGEGSGSVMVPKISSRGDTGGTVDTLEAGGYRFLDEPYDIYRKVLSNGGLFCKQSPHLVPADTALMAIRKNMGLMKSAELALASILGKKLPLGSRNIVLDVKLGTDSKMLPRFPSVLPDFTASHRHQIAQQALLLDRAPTHALTIEVESVSALNQYLYHLITGKKGSATGLPWVHKADVPDSMPFSQNVTILYSNGDMPQCRAIGRLPVLVQLGLELGDPEKPNLPTDSSFSKFYYSALASACKCCGSESQVRKLACKSWAKLKKELPLISGVDEPGKKTVDSEIMLIHRVVNGGKPPRPVDELTLDFLTIDFHDVPVWKQNYPKGCPRLMSADVGPLDGLFKELVAGKNDFKNDTGIGFWFHVLPSECLDNSADAEAGSTAKAGAVFSAFFRKGMNKRKLQAKLVDYLIRNWRWSGAN